VTQGLTRDKRFGGVKVDSFAAKLYINPDDNVLVGAEAICRYLGVSTIGTMWRWTEMYAFPAIKRPDGVWMTTMTAIDQWIFLAAEVVNENTDRSRGLNTTAEIAARRLQAQIDDPDLFAQKRAASARRAARGVGLLPGRKEPKVPYVTSGMERALRSMIHNKAEAEASMKIENCPECGGTHFGSYECPMPPNSVGPVSAAGLGPGEPDCPACKGDGYIYGGERGETLEQCVCHTAVEAPDLSHCPHCGGADFMMDDDGDEICSYCKRVVMIGGQS
jgi:rRNA maturation protein Nop10